MKSDLLPSNRAVVLKNRTCVYCGIGFDTTDPTKEHVVARGFVPKGKLNASWNLIVQACEKCNHEKSQLEDDLSAISMQRDALGRHAVDDETLEVVSAEKAQACRSRRTGSLVKDSVEELTVKIPLSSHVELTVDLIGPPQADCERIFRLAYFHVKAFSYWMTYDESQRVGCHFEGVFLPIYEAPRSDWGNSIHTAFMNSVVDWLPRVLVNTADDFFKVAIRRHPSSECWSWALEWNHNLRVIGLFGDRQVAEQFAATLPKLEVQTLDRGSGRMTHFVTEVPLEAKSDTLFNWNSQSQFWGNTTLIQELLEGNASAAADAPAK